MDILEWLTGEERLAEIPVIIFTGSSNPEHARRAYSLGVRRYMEKPPDFGALVDAVKSELGRWIEPESGSAYGS